MGQEDFPRASFIQVDPAEEELVLLDLQDVPQSSRNVPTHVPAGFQNIWGVLEQPQSSRRESRGKVMEWKPNKSQNISGKRKSRHRDSTARARAGQGGEEESQRESWRIFRSRAPGVRQFLPLPHLLP